MKSVFATLAWLVISFSVNASEENKKCLEQDYADRGMSIEAMQVRAELDTTVPMPTISGNRMAAPSGFMFVQTRNNKVEMKQTGGGESTGVDAFCGPCSSCGFVMVSPTVVYCGGLCEPFTCSIQLSANNL